METFESCKLDFAERHSHAATYDLHRDLLRLRRSDPTLTQPEPRVDGAVLSPEALLLRFYGPEDGGEDRLLIVNLGSDLRLVPAPEPLLAPPEGCRWNLLWSSEDPRYGGSGAPEPENEEEGWQIPGRAAVFLAPAPRPAAQDPEEREEKDHA